MCESPAVNQRWSLTGNKALHLNRSSAEPPTSQQEQEDEHEGTNPTPGLTETTQGRCETCTSFNHLNSKTRQLHVRYLKK